MIAQVVRGGNSLALRIPSALAQTLAVKEGKSVKITIENGNLIVTPMNTPPLYKLEDLLAGMNSENLHAEVDYGETIGHEFF
jgi:antitoxin MazE